MKEMEIAACTTSPRALPVPCLAPAMPTVPKGARTYACVVTPLIWDRVDSKHGRPWDEVASTWHSPVLRGPAAACREVAHQEPSSFPYGLGRPSRAEAASALLGLQACECSTEVTESRIWSLLISVNLTQKRSDAAL